MDERRLGALALAAAVVLGVLALAAAQRVYVVPAARAAQRRAELCALVQREAEALRRRPQLEAEVARLRRELGGDVARLPPAPQLDAFVAEAGRLAREQRVRIVSLLPREGRAQGDHGVLPVDMTLEGDFERLYAWMIELESAPRLARVETLKAGRAAGAAVRAEVQVALFVGGTRPLE
jgi:hypothetical protein